MKRLLSIAAGIAFFPALAAADVAVGLRGSPASMARQHAVAVESEYGFVKTSDDVRDAVARGDLVRLDGNADYRVKRMSHPYARPEVRLFIERLAAQYRAATGEQLVVTSLTRPRAEQPPNAHRLSIHPAGLAVDLRIPADTAARRWLENTLLGLESRGVLDVTRERRPPHYHVAVFPEQYRAHAAEQIVEELFAEWTAEARQASTAGDARAAGDGGTADEERAAAGTLSVAAVLASEALRRRRQA